MSGEERQIGLGGIVKVDAADNGTFVAIALMTEFTPPPRSRKGVEATALEDTLETEIFGIEEISEMEATHFHHEGSTNHTILETLFDSKAEVDWQYILPYSTPVTKQFPGKVKKLSPETVSKDKVISRKFTIQRTGPMETVAAE